MGVFPEEWKNDLEWITLRQIVNQTPRSEYEKNIFEWFGQSKDVRLLVMAFLNDFKFIEKVLQDEFGEEKAAELMQKAETMKANDTGKIVGSFKSYYELEYLK